MRRIMMRLILSFLVTLEEENGGFRQIFMGMEALIWEEKRDVISGLIQLKIIINTVSSGLIFTSCKLNEETIKNHLSPSCSLCLIVLNR